MGRIDPLTDALTSIKNSENAAKKECTIRPASRLLGEVLKVMQKNEYIGTYEFVDDGMEGLFKIRLSGTIKNCKAIKPRYAVGRNEFEKYEKRYLPAKDMGMLIVSTPKGVMTHREAKESAIGGRLIAFVY